MSPYRRRRVKLSKSTPPMMWLAIITLVAALVAFILGWGGNAIDFVESYFDHRDDSYRPMDLERAAKEQLLKQNQPF